MDPSPYDQSGFDVGFDWGLAGLRSLGPRARVVVVVDVLSFTTCVDVATSRGAEVLPYSGRSSDVTEYAATQNAIVASHRSDRTTWSLSPASLLAIPTGTRLVLPSPNGSSLTFTAAEIGPVVLAGCLRNASAVAAAAAEVGPPIAVIAAGERWDDSDEQMRVAVEDLIGAGAIIARLNGLDLSPEAQSARTSFMAAPSLSDSLRSSGSGRELIQRGFADDIEMASEHDSSSTVPVLLNRAFVAKSRDGATD